MSNLFGNPTKLDGVAQKIEIDIWGETNYNNKAGEKLVQEIRRRQLKIVYPGVAQLVARMVRDHEAVGSNPATRTINPPIS